MSFPVHVPGGGGGINQLTGGVVAGPGSGSQTANIVSLTKTVDCTYAGTLKSQVSVTAFDGTYATISGLGAMGALVPASFYANVNPTLFGPALAGTGASVTAFATPLATIAGLSGITSSMVGKSITFSGFGNSGNNGAFQIAAFISSSSVQVTNTSAVSPDTGGVWSISAGSLDTLTLSLTVDTAVLGTVINVLNYQGMFEIQTAAPTSLITGDTVNLAGILGNGPVYEVNGTHTVTVIDSTHFALQGTVFGQVYYTGGGTVQTGPLTLTLDVATNAASVSAFFAAITSTWPTVIPSLGGGVSYFGTNLSLILTGTTLGNTGSIAIGTGSANSTLALFQGSVYTGTQGVNVGGQSPTALQLAGFSNAGNNGTFNVHQWIDSATVTVFNPAAVTPDSGTHAVFSTGFYNDILSGILYGPALSGSAATITSFTTPLATVGGLTGMTPAIVGQSITFSGGFTNGGNIGTFTVVGYLSATSIVIDNPSAVSPDSGGTWSVPAGHLDGTTLIITVDGVGPTTLTLNGSSNAASMSAFFAAISSTWPTLTPSPNPTQGSLVLTENSLFGPTSTFTLGSGTANTWLGMYSATYSGVYANASFAMSMAVGSPPISGASVLSLTGAPVADFVLCTQSVGPFRCQVENSTSTFKSASFAATANPAVAYGSSVGVSSDGTTVNYDAPIPATPPAYVVGSQTGNLSGSTVFVDPSPNTPFTLTLSGGVTGVGSVVVQQLPFYSFVINGSTQPTTVSDNSNHTAQKVIGAGQAALVVGDGSSVWVIPAITEDNGRAKRYENYLTVRAATGSNLVNSQNTSLNGGDVVWGTSISGGPYVQGVVAPFMDGSFDTALSDNANGLNPVIPNGVAGADIGVLGNIVYMAGYNGGNASLYALSVGTGSLIAQTSLSYGLPTTLIAFKDGADPFGSIGGPTDCVFIVSNGNVATYGLATNGTFAQFQSITGSWEDSRGILLMGNNANATVGGGAFYSSIGVWTDPFNNEIWAADVVNDEIGVTNPISGQQPSAICLDREAGNFWVTFAGSQQIVLMNMNLATGQSLATTIVNTITYPNESEGVVNDILFDGAYLWAISIPANAYFQMTPNGFVVTSYFLQGDSNYAMTLTTDSRLYFDGSFVYISGLSRNNESVVARIDPGTGLPVEYFQFPVFSTRGLAFHGNKMFVATAPTINLNNSTVNQGSSGTVTASDSGGSASITGTTPNVTLTGLNGIYQGSPGQNVTLSGTSGGANDGTFPVEFPFIGANELTYNNSGATIPDPNNGSISWSVTGTAQFSDPFANWNPGVVGTYISLSNSSFSQNNGLWQIVSWTSATQIGIANPSTTDDLGGGIQWQMYGTTCGIQRMVSEPPGTDFGTLDSIIKTPAVAGWARGMRLGARVVEYTSYTGPTTFEIDVNPLPGTRVLFVDKDGNSPTNPLTISTPSATINGQTSCTLQGPYAFLEIEWDGTKWLIVRQSNQVTGGGSTRPVNPTLGQVCFDANVGLPIWWNGSQWINAAGIPV